MAHTPWFKLGGLMLDFTLFNFYFELAFTAVSKLKM